jgi:tRNA(Ile)-lysidine synthase
MSFWHPVLDTLARELRRFPSDQCYLLAYSGGLDSHALLKAMQQLREVHNSINLRAIYINHGLQSQSAQWGEHCALICQKLNIPYEQIDLQLSVSSGESMEAVAREARYAVFKEKLHRNEILLTAQHQDDQAETLLLQLLRGCGVNGLAAMPTLVKFGKGYHMRPWLSCTQDSLKQYASIQNLDYIEDPSNLDRQFDRNYLRHDVIPVVKQRWQEMGKALSRSAQIQAETRELLSAYASDIYKKAKGSIPDTLSVTYLKKLASPQQKLLIRYWLDKQNFNMPSEKKLGHIINDVIMSRHDAMPCVHWKGVEVRRYKDDIYAMLPLPKHDAKRILAWDIAKPLAVSSDVTLDPELLVSFKDILLEQKLPVTVRFRKGGERIRLQGHKHTVSVKKLLQNTEIPPWLRDRLPFIYAGERLIMISDLYHIDNSELG